jgi:hypothetical protein
MLISVASDFASFGAAGIMGAMWLWERRSSAQRERQLNESHERIQRDEQRLGKLTEVVQQNAAAIERFHQTQQEVCGVLKHLLEEYHHERSRR